MGTARATRRTPALSFWSAGPGVRTLRRRSTGLRSRVHIGSIPGPVGGQLADRAVVAADRRHRVLGVVREAPRLPVGRLVARQQAVAAEVPGLRHRPCEGPFVLVAPAGRRGRACRAPCGGPCRRPSRRSGRAARRAARPPRADSGRRTQLLVEVALHAPARSRARSRRRASSSRHRACRRGSTVPRSAAAASRSARPSRRSTPCPSAGSRRTSRS